MYPIHTKREKQSKKTQKFKMVERDAEGGI